jgi:sec-independent protein translocase protein TatA
MGRIGAPELLLILGIALVIFGPSKLPELGKSLGKAFGEFKSHANKMTDEFKDVSGNEMEEKGK